MDYNLAILLLIVSAVARVQCYINFINPAPAENWDQLNPTYKLGDIVDVQWDTNYSTVDLYLCQNLGEFAPDRLYPLEVNVSRRYYSWTVSLENVTFREPEGEYRMLYFAAYAYMGTENKEWNNTLYFDVSLPNNGLSAGAAAGIAASSTFAVVLLIIGLIIWRNMGDVKSFLAWRKSQRKPGANLTINIHKSSSYLLGDMDKGSTLTPLPLTPMSPANQPPHEVYEAP